MTDTLTDPPIAEQTSEAVQRLMERLQRQPDFPALQAAVTQVQRVARNDLAKVQTLAEAVLGDPGFSHRLLRLINAAHYASAGAGSIGSVYRAIAVMGFRSVQELSLSVRLLEQLPHDRRGRALREEFLRALLAARLAREMCRERRSTEEAYITALLQNLGRMLTAAHLPDDALAVREAVPRANWPLSALEQQVSCRRLGLSYGELGAQIGRLWGLPESLRASMLRSEWPAHAPEAGADTLRWLGWLANDLADLLLYVDPAQWAESCEQLARSAGPVTGQSTEELRGALARTREQLEDLAGTVGLPVSQLRDWHRADVVDGREDASGKAASGVGQGVGPNASRGAGQGSGCGDGRGDGQGHMEGDGPGDQQGLVQGAMQGAATAGPQGPTRARPARPREASQSLPMPLDCDPPDTRALGAAGSELLAAESLALSHALLDDQARAEVPGRALAALWQGLGARRAVLFLRRPGRTAYAPARLLGTPLRAEPEQAWSVDPAGGRDLFSRLCARGADTLIDDAQRPEIARYLPSHFQRAVKARHFLVLPMRARGRSVGMIYVDREDEQPFVIDDREMRLVRTLRNQAAIALS